MARKCVLFVKQFNRVVDFIKQKRIIRRLLILAGLAVFFLFHILALYLMTGKVLDFSYASSAVNFSQKIKPHNPVEKTENLKEIKSENSSDLKTSQFRPIVSVESQVDSPKIPAVVGPVASFAGQALYPNSLVLLEVNSDRFFTSVLSDGWGNWSWTNYGHPLEEGTHTLEACNISPYEINGKRDMFVQKYKFEVKDGNAGVAGESKINLTELSYEEKDNDGDLGDRMAKGELDNLLIFDASILNKKEYNPGDTMDVQLSFSAFNSDFSQNVGLNYEIYDSGNNKVSEFGDNLLVDGNKAFLKRVNLKEWLVAGDYILKITAQSGDDKYIQSLRFSLAYRPVITVGNMVITEERFSRAVVVNAVLLVALVITMIFVIIFEFRRFLIRGHVDENILHKRGYF